MMQKKKKKVYLFQSTFRAKPRRPGLDGGPADVYHRQFNSSFLLSVTLQPTLLHLSAENSHRITALGHHTFILLGAKETTKQNSPRCAYFPQNTMTLNTTQLHVNKGIAPLGREGQCRSARLLPGLWRQQSEKWELEGSARGGGWVCGRQGALLWDNTEQSAPYLWEATCSLPQSLWVSRTAFATPSDLLIWRNLLKLKQRAHLVVPLYGHTDLVIHACWVCTGSELATCVFGLVNNCGVLVPVWRRGTIFSDVLNCTGGRETSMHIIFFLNTVFVTILEPQSKNLTLWLLFFFPSPSTSTKFHTVLLNVKHLILMV